MPLQVSGTVDTDMTTMTADELMIWGLANLWKEGKEGGYTVRHGQKPVWDFGQVRPGSVLLNETEEDRPNFFEKAFPFPIWGRGIRRGTAHTGRVLGTYQVDSALS